MHREVVVTALDAGEASAVVVLVGAIRLREDRRKLPLFEITVLVYFVGVTGSLNLRSFERPGQFAEIDICASWVFHTCIRFCDGADSDCGFMMLRRAAPSLFTRSKMTEAGKG